MSHKSLCLISEKISLQIQQQAQFFASTYMLLFVHVEILFSAIIGGYDEIWIFDLKCEENTFSIFVVSRTWNFPYAWQKWLQNLYKYRYFNPIFLEKFEIRLPFIFYFYLFTCFFQIIRHYRPVTLNSLSDLKTPISYVKSMMLKCISFISQCTSFYFITYYHHFGVLGLLI